MKKIKFIFVMSALALSACGGGGSSSGSSAGTVPLPKTVATLSFTTISSAHSAPLQSIQMSVKLPQGVTIRSVTGQDGFGSLVNDTYSVVDSTESFSVISLLGTPLKFGTFAELKCNLATGSVLDANRFTSLNSPSFPVLKMSGVDAGTGNSVNLVPEIKVTMSVTFQ
jgi:hypothetical protein